MTDRIGLGWTGSLACPNANCNACDIRATFPDRCLIFNALSKKRQWDIGMFSVSEQKHKVWFWSVSVVSHKPTSSHAERVILNIDINQKKLGCLQLREPSFFTNFLPGEDEKGPSSIRPTLELFQGQHWGNSWEKGWSAYGLSLSA